MKTCPIFILPHIRQSSCDRKQPCKYPFAEIGNE